MLPGRRLYKGWGEIPSQPVCPISCCPQMTPVVPFILTPSTARCPWNYVILPELPVVGTDLVFMHYIPETSHHLLWRPKMSWGDTVTPSSEPLR